MANREIITSVGKGTALTQAEHDQNHKSFAGTVEEQTGTTYEVVYTDQNKTIELNNASMVCTLDAVLDIHSAIDTDNFEVTLKNTNATAATVQRSSTDTIEGSTSITLVENEVVTLQTDTTGGEWTIKSNGIVSSNTTLASPVINIGVSGTAILDEDDMVSDSDTKLATQQSIKAYVDNRVQGGNVSAAGSVTSSTGGFTAVKDATGKYTVTHSIGHTNYSVTASVVNATSDTKIITVGTFGSTSFKVFTNNYVNTAGDSDFSFQVVEW
jgi:putative NADH-flavin reductase